MVTSEFSAKYVAQELKNKKSCSKPINGTNRKRKMRPIKNKISNEWSFFMDNSQSTFPIKTYPYRVIYADTDAGGVVYYANYLRMFELARTFYIEEFGIYLAELAKNNVFFAVRHVEVNYIKPAVLGDDLELQIQMIDIAKASMSIHYEILRKSGDSKTLLVEGQTKVACCTMKDNVPVPLRIPKWVHNRLTGGQKTEKA